VIGGHGTGMLALVVLLRAWAPRADESSTVRVARPARPAIAGAAQADAGL
jgi:hypothetical protein